MKTIKEMHVEVAPEQLMSHFLDWSTTPPDLTMEPVYESPDVVGNSYEWTFRMLGVPFKGVTVYTDYVPAKRIAFRNFGALTGTATWAIEPEDGGSKLTIQADTGFAIPLIGRLLDPLMKQQWEKNVESAVRELEERTETEMQAA